MDNFPYDVLTPTANPWWLGGGVDNGGASLSGFTILDRIDGGPFWRCRLDNIQVYCLQKTLAMNAIQALSDGGAGVWIVPRRFLSADFVPHSDESPFGDLSLYTSESVSAVLAADVALYDSTLQLLVSGGALQAGFDFSFNHEDVGKRLYRARRVLAQETESDSVLYTLEISPPMRDDLTAGAVASFASAACVMRCTNPEVIAALDFNIHGEFTMEFEEAHWGASAPETGDST